MRKRILDATPTHDYDVKRWFHIIYSTKQAKSGFNEAILIAEITKFCPRGDWVLDVLAVPVPHHIGPQPTVRGARKLLPIGCLIIVLMIIAWVLFITGQTHFAILLFVIVVALALVTIIYQSLKPEKEETEE